MVSVAACAVNANGGSDMHIQHWIGWGRRSDISGRLAGNPRQVCASECTTLVGEEGKEVLQQAEHNATTAKTFLGEVLVHDEGKAFVRNQEKHVEKIREMFEALQASLEGTRPLPTKREIANFVGLINWCALTKTESFHLASFYDLVRFFSILGRTVSVAWDSEWKITAKHVAHSSKTDGTK